MTQTELLEKKRPLFPQWEMALKDVDRKNGRTRFKSVVSDISRDRDGEILEPAGASFAERMPLLWAHKSGREVKVYDVLGRVESHDIVDDHIETVASINDDASDTHRCAAKLVQDDDLVNLSHGFEPFRYLDAKGGEHTRERGDEYPRPEKGQRYLTWEMQEQSIVPLGSNLNAHIAEVKHRVAGLKGLGLWDEEAPEPELNDKRLDEWESELLKVFISNYGFDEWKVRLGLKFAEAQDAKRAACTMDAAHRIAGLLRGLEDSAKRAE